MDCYATIQYMLSNHDQKDFVISFDDIICWLGHSEISDEADNMFNFLTCFFDNGDDFIEKGEEDDIFLTLNCMFEFLGYYQKQNMMAKYLYDFMAGYMIKDTFIQSFVNLKI